MKHLLIAATLAFVVTAEPSLAGALSDPIVEPSVVAEDAIQSSEKLEGLLAVVAITLIILGAAGAF